MHRLSCLFYCLSFFPSPSWSLHFKNERHKYFISENNRNPPTLNVGFPEGVIKFCFNNKTQILRYLRPFHDMDFQNLVFFFLEKDNNERNNGNKPTTVARTNKMYRKTFADDIHKEYERLITLDFSSYVYIIKNCEIRSM